MSYGSYGDRSMGRQYSLIVYHRHNLIFFCLLIGEIAFVISWPVMVSSFNCMTTHHPRKPVTLPVRTWMGNQPFGPNFLYLFRPLNIWKLLDRKLLYTSQKNFIDRNVLKILHGMQLFN